jgi:SAM-dependent methyltransferase
MISNDRNYDVSPTKDERDAWDRRADVSGSNLSGVLFKGFPEALNRALHKFHSEIILRELSGIEGDASILDAGCGYGRISVEIRNCSSKFKIFGLDSSWWFIKSYMGHVPGNTAGIRGDIIHLPFQSGSFNAVIVVTCLMYLPYHLQSIGIKEFLRVTKKGGTIIFVEPGLVAQKIYSGFGLTNLLRKGKRSGSFSTGGTGFRLRELVRWIHENGGVVLRIYGNPGFTLMLLPLLAVSRLSSAPPFQKLYRLSSSLDKILKNKGTFSTHMGLVVGKG